MAGFNLQLPTIQNWSCHSCSGCCREHIIEVTEEERQRILAQNWSSADGIPADQQILVPFAGPPWNRRYRLGHQEDGACVFLDEKGLCRIHTKFGEEAKPLPCLLYPFAFHPAGKKVAISLRFSCPSVVDNLGKPITDRREELKSYTRLVVPQGVANLPAPAISSGKRLDWPDFLRFIEALDHTLADPNASIAVKLLRALFWLKLVEQARFDTIRGERLAEFLQIVIQAARSEVSDDLSAVEQPSRTGRMMFRMLLAQYARKDTQVDVESGIRGRIRLFRAAVRFARGKGNVPPLQKIFKQVPFETLEQPFGGLPDEAEEIFTRYFRVKVQGIHFCGRAYYDLSFVEGFRSLVLIYPSILWLARWLAAGDGRRQLAVDDIKTAISSADHCHAYSPAFGRGNFRRRVRMLSRLGDIHKLCARYSL